MSLRRRCSAGLARSNLSYRARIPAHPRIRRQQGDSFHLRLRNQDSIEGIFMNRRQIVDGNNMLTTDRKLERLALAGVHIFKRQKLLDIRA